MVRKTLRFQRVFLMDGQVVNNGEQEAYLPYKLSAEALGEPVFDEKGKPVGSGTSTSILEYAKDKYREVAKHSDGKVRKAWLAIIAQIKGELARRADAEPARELA